VFSWAPNSGL